MICLILSCAQVLWSLLRQQRNSSPGSGQKISESSSQSSMQELARDSDSDNLVPISIPVALGNQSTDHSQSNEARSQDGILGYIADPAALRLSIPKDMNYFDLLTKLHTQYRKGTFTENVSLLADNVCNLGPGRSFEEDGGFKLLTEKVVVAEPPIQSNSRILCCIYTYPKMRDLARVQALTWGYKCDGFLAFSTETIPELGVLNISHDGEESYFNMWQKTRSIWAYISKHYLEEFDWFHLGGDDLFLIVNNLRRFLLEVDGRKSDPAEPVFLGLPVKRGAKEPVHAAGGPGYTLNREALRRFALTSLPNCSANRKVSHEDRLMSWCLHDIGIPLSDTRDRSTGEPQYHDCSPNHLYTFRAGQGFSFHSKIAIHWENMTHPSKPNEFVGPKHGLDAAAKYSVAFHDIYHPIYAARLNAILFPRICPSTSILGRALRLYGILS